MRTYSIACLLGAPLLTLFLQGGGQVPPAKDAPQTETDRVRIDRKKLRQDMQGAWRLVELNAPRVPSGSRKDVGYCLIYGNCFSLELHMGWMPDAATIEGRSFQSGTHTFEIDDEGQMRTSTLIGAYISRANALEFESPGFSRTYKVTFEDKRLSLARVDGQTLLFERMADVTQERDFFGRRKRDGAKPDVGEQSDDKDER